MTAHISRRLQNILQDKSKYFLETFTKWKLAGSDDFYEFGKDSSYATPEVNGKSYILRHVHLVPVTDKINKARWDNNWRHDKYRRRTSDRVLVYVEDSGNYLLIDILPEPDAHRIARMSTAQDQRAMQLFALVAEAFIFNRRIIY